MLNSEKMILQAFLKLPTNPLLDHRFELQESCLAGFVSRFLKGERFEQTFTAFSDSEYNEIFSLIKENESSENGKDLLTSFLLSIAVCNILNKYRKGSE